MSSTSLSLLGFIFVLVSDFTVRFNSFGGVSNKSTFLIGISNVIGVLAFAVLFMRLSTTNYIPGIARRVLLFCLVWGIISFIFGLMSADDYWSWKTLLLSHLFTILIPLVVIVGIHYELFIKVFRFICYIVLPISLLFIPYSFADDVQIFPRLAAPVMLMLLFSFYLPIRWRVFFLVVSTASIGIDLGYRTNLIRFLVSIGLLCLIAFKIKWVLKVWPALIILIFSIPLIFLTLGLTNEFNIFRDNNLNHEVVSRKGKAVESVEINVDTRTFLYVEVFNSMLRRKSSFLIGEGGASGYDTDWFFSETLSKQGRFSSEVGFLNILLHQGIIGVTIYALILIISCVLGMGHSNNKLCKMLSIFLIVRWPLLFIEEIPLFDVNNYINWVVIGLCLSNRFRALTDQELRVQFTKALKNPLGRR